MSEAFDPAPGLALLGHWLERQDCDSLGTRLAAVAEAFGSDRAGWTPLPPAPHLWVDRRGRPTEPVSGTCIVAGSLRVPDAVGRASPVAKELLNCLARVMDASDKRSLKSAEATRDSDLLARRLQDAAVIVGRAAHDFDNILQGVLGFADLTVPLLRPDSAEGNFLAEMLKVAGRGLRLTRQMHQLNRGGHAQPRPASLAAVVAEEERRFRDGLPANVTFTVTLPSAIPTVAMDASPLRQVIAALLDNARESLPATGGTVSLSVRPDEWGEKDLGWLGSSAFGRGLEIGVRDDGSGVPPEVRRRLFVEPFFTTKVRHAGLGLAIAFRILYAHGGSIRLESDPGSGTLVRVRIPAALP